MDPEDFPGGLAQLLWEIEQIKQLKARYFRFLDARDWDAFAQLFTPDCRHLDYDGPGSVIDRHDVYVAMLQRVLVPGRSVHQGHMPEITLTSPTEAEGIWAMFDYVDCERADAERFIGYGHYHETYRKGPQGWQISSKRLVRIRVDGIQ
jgi:hypothetical protein